MGFLEKFKKNEYKQLKKLFFRHSQQVHGIRLSKQKVNELCKKSPKKCLSYKKIFFSIYKDIATYDALEVAEELLKEQKEPSFIKVVAIRYQRIGNIKRAKELLLSIGEREYVINDITKKNLELVFNACTQEEIESRVDELISDFPHKELKVYELTFSILKDEYTALAIKYGMKYFERNPLDLKFISILEKRVRRLFLYEELKKINDNKKEYQYFKKLLESSLFKNKVLDEYGFKEQLSVISHKFSSAQYIKAYITELIRKFPKSEENINNIASKILQDIHKELSLEYKTKVLNEVKKASRLKHFLKKNLFNSILAYKKNNLSNMSEKKYLLTLNKNPLFKNKRLNLKDFKSELVFISSSFSSDSMQTISKYVVEKFLHQEEKIYEVLFTVLKDTHTLVAIQYGKRYIELNPESYNFAKVLVNRMNRVDLTDESLYIAKKVLEYSDDTVLQHMVFRNEMKLELNKLEEFYDNRDFDELESRIAELEKKYIERKSALYRIFHDFYRRKDYKKSEVYALESLKLKEDEQLIKSLYDLHIYYGSISKASSVLPKKTTDYTLQTKKDNISSLLYLFKYGFDIAVEDYSKEYYPIESRVLYLLHNRLPYNSGGYATRSHGLLTNIAKFSWDIRGVSRLGYPWDKMPDTSSQEMDEVDNIKYYRLLEEGIGLGKLPMKDYLEAYAKALLEKAKEERPEIIHAASNHMNGLVGNYVAKCLGIKSVYEVRGLWEITRISRQPEWKNTEYYELMVKLEVQACNGADTVLTLTEALKEEMISRGVDANKIQVLPNGVTSSRFEPLDRDMELETSLHLKDKVVIGYIGSVVAYEGLEYLVDAIKILVTRGITNLKVLIVGDGAVLENIKSRVEEQKLNDYFIFTGRVPHEEVERYYSLVDITPFPRKGQPVCEMVSPLKPFEAMAMEKAILSSNVKALTEIVQDNYNGLCFEKDNIEDFANKLEQLINDDKLREKLGKQARKWVVEQRDWRVISKKLDSVYKKLGESTDV